MTEPVRPAGDPAEGPSPWRLLTGDGRHGLRPQDGPDNMALDAALLDAVAAGAPPVLRLYRWAPATLSFGRNQPARGLYDADAAGRRGIALVRRPTGGQAVLHDDELTYAVIAPVDLIGKPRSAYRRINRALVAGLAALGVAARVAGDGPGQGARADGGHEDGGAGAPEGAADGPGKDWLEACFRRPERGEVVAGGRKLVGSAQRTQDRTILQHGSILLGGSQAAAEELLVARVRGGGPGGGGPAGPGAAGGVGAGWTTVAEELGRRPVLEGLVAALVAGFEAELGIGLVAASPEPAERAGARELRGRFASDAWTWRR